MTATQHAANQGNEGSLIAVLGAGSWGTALAMQLMRAGSGVVLWEESKRIINDRTEPVLPAFDTAFEIFSRGIAR